MHANDNACTNCSKISFFLWSSIIYAIYQGLSNSSTLYQQAKVNMGKDEVEGSPMVRTCKDKSDVAKWLSSIGGRMKYRRRVSVVQTRFAYASIHGCPFLTIG